MRVFELYEQLGNLIEQGFEDAQVCRPLSDGFALTEDELEVLKLDEIDESKPIILEMGTQSPKEFAEEFEETHIIIIY